MHRAQGAQIYFSYIAMNATNMDYRTCFEWRIKITAKLIIILLTPDALDKAQIARLTFQEATYFVVLVPLNTKAMHGDYTIYN